MKLKKILAVALSALMLGSSASLLVSAEPVSSSDKTFRYVALGDSIAAGYGLTESAGAASDPALILSEDLIANPVQEAYAAVFGGYLEELGKEYNVSVSTTNLSSTAYRAKDVAKTITTPGYQGEIAVWILETFSGEGTSAALIPYHDIYAKYLPDADLVSIQLGGNDVIMALLLPMVESDNPVLTAASISVVLTLFGCDMKTALGGGLQVLMKNKDAITKDSFIEAVNQFVTGFSNMDQLVVNSAEEVKDVVEAVKAVNETADIALVGMFNPYGNSLEYNGMVYDMSTVVKNIFAKAASLIYSTTEVPVEDEITDISFDEDVEDVASNCSDNLVRINVLSAIVEKLKECGQAGMGFMKNAFLSYKKTLDNLMSIVVDECAYPMQYLLLGQGLDPSVNTLNEKLSAMAEEYDATYVDVYNISNECNLDPHPLASGHQEIANILYDTLADQIADTMEAMTPAEPLVSKSTISAETIKVGEKVKVRCAAEGGRGDYQYAVYYKKVRNDNWHLVHDFSETYAFSIKPAMAAKYEILVKVMDKSGTVVSQNFQLQVTSK